MKFAVIGGDMRMVSLASQLLAAGHEVAAFALDAAPEGAISSCALSASAAAQGADCVILPLPAVRSGDTLNAPLSQQRYNAAELLRQLPAGTLVCAGKPDDTLKQVARESGLELADYFAREELVILNALATAEGAISVILKSSPITIWESRVLIIGAGRIGRLLATRLRALGAEVTVSARRPEHKAQLRALGCAAADTRCLGSELAQFDTIVNTVPAMVLDEARLKMLRPDTLLLDLASRPGGMDHEAAREMKLKTIWALGLPAETAPVTAGRIIMETVLNIVSEREPG